MFLKSNYTQKINIITFITICVLFMSSFAFVSQCGTESSSAFQMAEFITVKGSVKALVDETVNGTGVWHNIYTYFCTSHTTTSTKTYEGWDENTHAYRYDLKKTETNADDAFSIAFKAFLIAGKVVGAIWLVILVTGDILKNLNNENLEVHDAVFKPLILLIIVMLLIINADRITGTVFDMAGYLNEAAGNVKITFSNTSSADTSETPDPGWVADSLPDSEKDKANSIYSLLVAANNGEAVGKNAGLLTRTGMMFSLLIPWVGAIASYGFGVFLIIQLMFEIGIRRALIPLAMVWIYQDGIRSPGVRYMRQLFACVIQIAIFVIVSNVSESLQNMLMAGESGITQSIMLIIANFSALGVMSKSKEFINSAVSG